MWNLLISVVKFGFITPLFISGRAALTFCSVSNFCRCVLAVIIVVNLRGALRKFADVPRMWRANQIDTSIWLITMATSALVNTELGLLVGVLVSAFGVLGRTQRAQVLELGRAATREHYKDLSSYRGLRTCPGVAVFRYEAPIYYANQSLFKKSLYKCVGLDPARERTRRIKFKNAKQQKAKGEKMSEMGGEKEMEAAANVTLMLQEKSSRNLRSLVIDCSAVLFLDTAGANALKEVRKDYGELGIEVVLAQCNTSVLDTLERGGYYSSTQGGDVGENQMIFHTIEDGVCFAQSLCTPNGDYDSKC